MFDSPDSLANKNGKLSIQYERDIGDKQHQSTTVNEDQNYTGQKPHTL